MEKYVVDVPFKGNGTSARFFNDRVEFGGRSIRYDDIETLATSGSVTINTYFGIPVGRDFTGATLFIANDGKKHVINMNAMTIFGIPILLRSPRKQEELYPSLYEALDTIVAKSMAQKLIDRVKNGGTIEVAGLIINSLEAKSKQKRKKKKASKEIVVIHKENYRESLIANISDSFVTVYDTSGDALWRSSPWCNRNILLIPYILDAIFGKSDEQD